jgi:hypothetical protein
MEKKRFVFATVFAVLAVLAVFGVVLAGCEVPTSSNLGGNNNATDISWSAAADGGTNATSTQITFTFNVAVSGLAVADITVTNGTGSATKGALSESQGGKVWELGITVGSAGSLSVNIIKTGVANKAVTVTVYKAITGIDKAALIAAISTATAAKNGVAVDTSAANVPSGTDWVTQEVMTALDTAITAANTVSQNAAATQDAVNNAVTALNTAVDTFNNAKQAGTGAESTVTKTALTNAITAANGAKSGIVVNTVAANVETGTDWVTQTVMTALESAISAANTVAQNAAANQDTVDGAVTALNGAVTTFNGAKQAGTGATVAAKNELSAAIATAGAAKEGVVVNTSAANVLVGTYWVTQAVKTTLESAIATAEAVTQNASTTQQEVTDAVAALNTAVSTFTNAKSAGTKTVGSGNGGGTGSEGGGSEPIYFSTEYTYSTGTDINPDESTETAWVLTAGEYSTVYFAVGKTASDTVTVGGADATKVTQAEKGETVDGIEATDELAVFAVDTGDLVFDGGARSFSLGDVAVALNVVPNLTGAALFKVTRATVLKTDNNPEGYDEWEPLTGAETLTRIDSRATGTADNGTPEYFEKMLDAVAWINGNAETQTEYVLRVEKGERLPRIQLGLNSVENVVLRLRGTADSAKILKHDGTNDISKGSESNLSGDARLCFFYIGRVVSNGTHFKKTLILGDNITVKGNESSSETKFYGVFRVEANATLVLEKSAVITKHLMYDEAEEFCPIFVTTATAINGDPTVNGNGKVRIEGGSITDCPLIQIDDIDKLIFFSGTEDRYYPGSFYMAKSTENNPITFSGNYKNDLFFYSSNYTLTDFTDIGLSVPAAAP